MEGGVRMQETIDAFNRAHSVPQQHRPERGGAKMEVE